jgi:hypothetical protein
MSGVDPECHPQLSAHAETRICAKCFEDPDLVDLIEGYEGPLGCSFCGESDAPTAPFDDVAEHIRERLETFYGKAGDQLPYESREGGYQGWHTSTWELLVEDVGIALPRDTRGQLLNALVGEIGDDVWCEYDWLALEPDESLESSWESFCSLVKHDRRFFFHDLEAGQRGHPDERSPAQFLNELGSHIDRQGLIRQEPERFCLYRARVRDAGEQHTTPTALGPPPSSLATQSNRMNPPGISMFYAADNPALATAETRGQSVSIGTFQTTRPIHILDLANMPEVPGFFSSAERMRIFTLSFLTKFAELIIQPVLRNDRTQIDYIPTQVFTEFLRDFPFEDGKIDGVRYRSATGHAGANIVLFATPDNVEGVSPNPDYGPPPNRWLQLVAVEHK